MLMMKSSSSASSASSTSVTAEAETHVLSSSSSLPPRLSLQSADLQAEFLQEYQNKFRSHSDVSESSVVSSAASPPSTPLCSPFSPTPSSSPWSSPSSSSSSSPCYNRQARLSLSSPALLSELKQSRTRSLRRVPAHNGLTTVFSGRGRGGGGGGGGGGGQGRETSCTAYSKSTANQKTS